MWAIPSLCQHPAVVSRAWPCMCGAALLCCCNRGTSELLPVFTGPFHFTATSTAQAAACAASKATAASKSNTHCPPEAGDLCTASSKALSEPLACPLQAERCQAFAARVRSPSEGQGEVFRQEFTAPNKDTLPTLRIRCQGLGRLRGSWAELQELQALCAARILPGRAAPHTG